MCSARRETIERCVRMGRGSAKEGIPKLESTFRTGREGSAANQWFDEGYDSWDFRPHAPRLTEKYLKHFGDKIIAGLSLTLQKGKVKTSHGMKTNLGLARLIQRWQEDVIVCLIVDKIEKRMDEN